MKFLLLFLLLLSMLSAQERPLTLHIKKVKNAYSSEREFEILFNPNPFYDFFIYAQKHPFPDSHGPTISRTHLAYFSEGIFLSYLEPTFIKYELNQAGFLNTICFEDQKTDSQGYLSETSNSIFVVFRGTDTGSLRDYFHDALALQIPWGKKSKVHQGFSKAFDGTRRALHSKEIWSRLKTTKKQLYLVGHSLGGAIATLVGYHFPNAIVYTFGAPAVGNEEFTKQIKNPTFRVINRSDLVPMLPPKVLALPQYSHHSKAWQWVGDLADFATIKMQNNTQWIRYEFLKDPSFFTGDNLNDHAAIYYSLRAINLLNQ